MRVSELRIGTELLNGRVIVTYLKRKGPMCRVELTSGDVVRSATLHKSQPIMVALVGLFGAGKKTGSYGAQPHRPRVSDPRWRTEALPSWEQRAEGSETALKRNHSGGERTVRSDSRY